MYVINDQTDEKLGEKLTIGRYTGRVTNEYRNSDFIRCLANIREWIEAETTRELHQVRNTVYHLPIEVAGRKIELCVKAFPGFSLVRSRFYRSKGGKAFKAFRAALHLKRRGIGVPDPVAYLEYHDGRRLVESYYIDRFVDETADFQSEIDALSGEENGTGRIRHLIGMVAAETRKMHASGFVHKDFGQQNILIRKDTVDELEVVFIDLNRGRVRERFLNMRERAADLARLHISRPWRELFLREYFEEDALPLMFRFWESLYRVRLAFHRGTRRLRHPIQTIRSAN